MRVTILGKGAARGVSRIWETGQGHRFGKRAGWAGAGLCGLEPIGRGRRAGVVSRMSLRLVERCDRPLLRGPGRAWFCGLWVVFSASRARPASPHVRLKTRLLVGAGRPSDQTAGRPALPPGPHDSPGDSPSTSDCPTITPLASVFRSPSLGTLCCRRWHNGTPSQPETRDKSVRAPRLFEAQPQSRQADLMVGVVELH